MAQTHLPPGRLQRLLHPVPLALHPRQALQALRAGALASAYQIRGSPGTARTTTSRSRGPQRPPGPARKPSAYAAFARLTSACPAQVKGLRQATEGSCWAA